MSRSSKIRNYEFWPLVLLCDTPDCYIETPSLMRQSEGDASYSNKGVALYHDLYVIDMLLSWAV